MLKSILVFALFLTVALSVKINIDRTVHKVIEHETWIEEKNDLFRDVKVGSLLGWNKAKRPEDFEIYNMPGDSNALPTNFDARQNWPNCSTIATIQNQARCGSCWAFGAVESISDRFCTMKNETVQLSFQDLVTCDGNDDGCQGGDAYSAYSYVQKKGLVTAACSPYTIPTCPPAQQPCLNFVNTPKCVEKCQSNYTGSFQDDLHFVDKTYSVSSLTSMQTELVNNGPFEACFNVYEDFLGYKSGVYQHTTGKFLGGHCIKIMGYGELNGTPYWLAANSWTTYWGDQGTFMILRGKNECGIESDVVAGVPK
ncbi:peptidase C1A family protein [Tieghemostelium lacteum]|uniref:Peptidase C1A family protein n=1 Tax=Tieghemostelium lacteum TaxID=361077 RepID=A0A152A8C9_TIELA|nr:peptidase C1A family protein [Tieghemostelium lacteum]|eukprot:KYR02454.1 peptidase C1A family protein [Tieghemostelium lacteum]